MLLSEAYSKYISENVIHYYGQDEVNAHEQVRATWKTLWPDLEADSVTPKLFLEWRKAMITGGIRGRRWFTKSCCRATVERRHFLFMRCLTWLMTMEIVSTETHYRMAHVPHLKSGRSEAEESDDIPAVPLRIFNQTMKHFKNEAFRSCLELIRFSGMRPDEACRLHKDDIDKNPPGMPGVWVYAPKKHKTAHLGQGRIIVFGPECQEIIRRFEAKKRLVDGPLFRNDRGRPIARHNLARRLLSVCRRHGIPPWTPNQARKLRSNEVFQKYGPEGEQATLGHNQETARRYYLMRNLEMAAQVARETG